MPNNLTDAAEVATLNWLTGQPSTVPTLPLRLHLTTNIGTDSTAGTEVAGGSYVAQDADFDAADADGAALAALVRFDGLPDVDVAGLEIRDSAATPVRWWWGPLVDDEGSPVVRSFNAGDACEFAPGEIVMTIN